MSKRSRKRAAQKSPASSPGQTVAPSPGPASLSTVPPKIDPVPQTPVESGPVWEHSLLDLEPDPVSERDLRRLMADWRKGRATRHLWDLIQDGYVAILAIVMLGAMVVSVVVRAQGVISQCSSASCQSGRSLLPWAALFGVLSLTLLVSRLFGPVVASAAEGFWLMEAPIRRGRLLVGRLVGVVLLVVGYAMDRPSLSLAAMTLIWLAVGVAFLYVAVDMVRHPSGDRPLLITDYLDDDDLDWADEGPDDADLFPEGLLDAELPSASEPQGPADPAPASADDTPDSVPDPDDQPGQPSA